MKEILITAVLFSFTMCYNSKEAFRQFDCKSIEKVLITDSEIKKTWIVDNDSQLCFLFKNYLSTSKKRLFKFKAVYTISFLYQGQDYLIIVNKNHVKINGITYVMDYDLENYIRTSICKE